jgi:hypothetical protein
MSETASPIQQWLESFVRAHGGIAGSVHRRSGPDELELAAHLNLPPPVVAAVVKVPRGKGMAGLALERDTSISTCNIKTDATGDVRPGAKAVNAQAAVAMPVHDANGVVRAVVGIAFRDEKELTEDELRGLERAAAQVPG